MTWKVLQLCDYYYLRPKITSLKRYLKNKAYRNYVTDITALFPFMALLLTGVIMLIYHSGISEQVRILFLRGDQWLLVHRVLTVIALPLVALHLIFHWGSIIRLFISGKATKHKPLNLSLFILLLCTAITSLLSWIFFRESETGEWLRAVHNKFGMGLVVFFSVHIAIHLSWLVRMSDKYLINRSQTRDQLK